MSVVIYCYTKYTARTFPEDLAPNKPDAFIGAEQAERVRRMEFGHVATGRLWEPGALNVQYLRRRRLIVGVKVDE